MAGRAVRLVIEGLVSDDAVGAFDGMTPSRKDGNTVLVGAISDQPQLQGLLQRVSDLGLTLLSATVADEDPD